MKALLMLLAITFTAGFAVADNWQEVPVEKISQYKQAIASGFNKSSMTCTLATYNQKNELIESSDDFAFNWSLLQNSKNKIFINTSHSQPALMLRRLAPSPLPINKNVYFWQIYLTTSDDFNSIISVDTTHFKSYTRVVHKNVGTIINPDYKDVRVTTEERSLINCAPTNSQ